MEARARTRLRVCREEEFQLVTSIGARESARPRGGPGLLSLLLEDVGCRRERHLFRPRLHEEGTYASWLEKAAEDERSGRGARLQARDEKEKGRGGKSREFRAVESNGFFSLPISGESLKGKRWGDECLSLLVSATAKASNQGPSATDFGAKWPGSFQGAAESLAVDDGRVNGRTQLRLSFVAGKEIHASIFRDNNCRVKRNKRV